MFVKTKMNVMKRYYFPDSFTLKLQLKINMKTIELHK